MLRAALFNALILATADGAPDAATFQNATVFLVGLTACAVIGNQIMGAVLSFRKLKGSDPEDDKRYATRSEHQALRDDVTTVKAEVSAVSKTINNQFSDIQRALGRLEGKLDGRTKYIPGVSNPPG